MSLAERLAKASGLDLNESKKTEAPADEKKSFPSFIEKNTPETPAPPTAPTTPAPVAAPVAKPAPVAQPVAPKAPQPEAKKEAAPPASRFPTAVGSNKSSVQDALENPIVRAKKEATTELLRRLGSRLNDSSITEEALSGYVRTELDDIITAKGLVLSPQEKARLLKEIEDDALGLGPLQSLLEDSTITEIMVNGKDRIYVEQNGRLTLSPKVFQSEEQLRRVIDRIVSRVGRRIDESSPMVDARLLDGSRVNAIIPPLSPKGSSLTIRKFSDTPLTVNDLLNFGTFTPQIAELLKAAVEAKLNILVSGGTGTGKAVTHDTVIPTPTGFTTMGEIKVGDEIFDHHGKTGVVLGKFPQGAKKVYEVVFNTGETIKADADHNWYVSTRYNRLYKNNEHKVMTTSELLAANVEKIRGEKPRYDFQVPVLEKAVTFTRSEEKQIGLKPEELPIHPYVYGLWLGDGKSYRPALSGQLEDIEAYNKVFANLGIDYTIEIPEGMTHGDVDWFKISSGIDFTKALRILGHMEKLPGGNKKPNEMYLYANEDARRFLLAGLIDSDGTFSGQWSFANTELTLTDFVRKLASNLGYKTTVHKQESKEIVYNDELASRKAYEIVTIKTQDSIALLSRKNEKSLQWQKAHVSGNRDSFRTIVAINETDVFEEMSCIQVSTDDSTFMIGETFITTHNTTLLNVISNFIPSHDRIVTVEDALELQLSQDHVVSLETRPPNLEGTGEVTIRDLVKNSLRMRPDRLVVGECRGGEALDMIQAFNTGHDGSLSTIHSNSPRDCIARLETLILMAGIDLPVRAIRDQIAGAIDLIVQIQRLRDGTRRLTHITEVTGMEGDVVTLQDAFLFDFSAGVDETGRFLGVQRPTGVRPRFTEKLEHHGIPFDFSIFEV